MPRERLCDPAKKWSMCELCFQLTPEVSVSLTILSDLTPLVEACAKEPGALAYVVLARVVDRSKSDFIERRDVTPESLADFLPLRDAAEPVTDLQLADAAVAWVRSALPATLGDRETTTIKVTFWRPKGTKTLACLRVTVSRAPSEPSVEVSPSLAEAAPLYREATFISENGPTWRAMIAEAVAAGEPESWLIRGAASVAEAAERDGVPQLPVNRAMIDVLRGSPRFAAIAARPEGPTLNGMSAERFLRACRPEPSSPRILFRTAAEWRAEINAARLRGEPTTIMESALELAEHAEAAVGAR